jgi:hypothetical protein
MLHSGGLVGPSRNQNEASIQVERDVVKFFDNVNKSFIFGDLTLGVPPLLLDNLLTPALT